jgi:corrinoid protein of di/trimethylamine methyltransferase
MKELLDQMKAAILDGEEEEAVALAEQALADKLDLKTVMDEGFLKGIQEAGKLFADGEYYLPDLVCSADAMKAALAVLDEELKRPASGFESKGKVVMTTVQGDVHDIGKIIVGAMLTAVGYEVHDLGVDVPNEDVLTAIDQIKPDVVGLSALLTTTMVEQKNIIEALKAAGKRGGARVIVGGAPVTHEWANKIGADGYSDDAISAVTLVNNLLS